MNAAPFVAVLAVVAGIVGAERMAVPSSNLIVLLGLVALGGAWFAVGRVARLALVALGLVIVSGVAMTRALDGQRASPLAGAIARHATTTLRGTLVEDPDGPAYTVSALVRVETGGTHRTLLLQVSGDGAMVLRVLDAGDRIVVRGRLGPLRSGIYDERARWRHAVGRLDDATVDDFAAPRGLLAIANVVRGHVLRGLRSLAPTQRALTAGFLLGDTRDIPPAIEHDYRDAGLSHLLAVSGENVC